MCVCFCDGGGCYGSVEVELEVPTEAEEAGVVVSLSPSRLSLIAFPFQSPFSLSFRQLSHH